MAELVLAAEQLTVTRGAVRVLERIDLQARSGEVLAVLGPNGAGKSTLLRALCGLQAYSGAVRVAGADLAQLSSRERATRLAFVPQQSALRSALPVHEVVAQGRYAHKAALSNLGARDRAAIERAIDIVDVAALAERPFTKLSLGEQRRVLIARALCTGAQVLCLDEPTAAADVKHALQLYRLLRGLAAQGHAVIVVLHQLDDALQHADRALLLHAGRCLASGLTADVVTAAAVREVYGVHMSHRAALGFELADDSR
jgi:iron complex transport system ATP-binding protein